jgi:trans-2,3-dihydro-3-hydroxyanthranilate isomerase
MFVFSLEPGLDGATVYSRMYAPGLGITEDPATGSASGPLGCYLVRHGAVLGDAARRMRSMQGVKMGRPSWIHVAIGGDADAITSVKVGGKAVLMGEGYVDA